MPPGCAACVRPFPATGKLWLICSIPVPTGWVSVCLLGSLFPSSLPALPTVLDLPGQGVPAHPRSWQTLLIPAHQTGFLLGLEDVVHDDPRGTHSPFYLQNIPGDLKSAIPQSCIVILLFVLLQQLMVTAAMAALLFPSPARPTLSVSKAPALLSSPSAFVGMLEQPES